MWLALLLACRQLKKRLHIIFWQKKVICETGKWTSWPLASIGIFSRLDEVDGPLIHLLCQYSLMIFSVLEIVLTTLLTAIILRPISRKPGALPIAKA
jgi:hypothetical protein